LLLTVGAGLVVLATVVVDSGVVAVVSEGEDRGKVFEYVVWGGKCGRRDTSGNEGLVDLGKGKKWRGL
jgi:hypothetical protein